MLSKAKIKFINQLKQKKFRDKSGLFFVEGIINNLDFINSHFEAVEVYLTERAYNENLEKLNDTETNIVSKNDIEKITALKAASEILGLFKIPDNTKNNALSANSFSIILDDIRDPGNLGTIIRTADWFGITNIFCSPTTVDAYNPKVVQASMGSLSRVHVHYANLKELLTEKPDDIEIFAATMHGKPLNKIHGPKKGALVIGSEAHGISEEIMSFVDQQVTIPLVENSRSNKPESLNAAIACSIICYALQISG